MSVKPKRDIVNSSLSSISQIIIYIKNPNGELLDSSATDGKSLDDIKPNAEPFKLSMLDLPPTLNKSGLVEYPYIIENKKFPSDKLYGMLIIDYGEVVRFFFDKKFFIATLGPENLAGSDVQGDTTPQDILDYNVKVMISLLFPTKYPVPRNHFNSYGHFITNKDTTVALKGQVFDKLFSMHTYTYINLFGSKYTITRVVWLNDLYNNPVYRSLVNEYSKFYKWLTEAKPQIIIEIKQYLLKLLSESNCQHLFDVSNPDNKCLSDGFKYDYIDKKYVQTADVVCFSAFSKEVSKLYATMVKRILSGGNTDKYIQKLDDLDELYIALKDIEISVRSDIKGEIAKFKDEDIQKSESSGANQFLVGNPLTFLNQLYALKKAYDTSLKASGSTTVSDRTIDYSPATTECMKMISDTLDKIFISKRVYDKYLMYGKYVINESDEKIEREIRSKYETLSKFSQNVQSLKKRKSANPVLQSAVAAFINGSNDDTRFGTSMENIQEALLYNKLIRQTLETDRKILNTSVGRINADDKSKPQYEIYVGMDLVKGELTKENINNVKCAYEGYYLGQQLSLWSLATNEVDFVVVDLVDLEKRSNKKPALPAPPAAPAAPPAAPVAPPAPPVAPAAGGGRTSSGRKMTRKQFFAMKANRKSRKVG